AEAERKARQAQEVGSYLRRIALINQRLATYQLSDVPALLEECPPHLRHLEWYYLRRWYHGTPFVDLAFLTTPTQAWCVAFDPDGRGLAAALQGGAVKIWDVPTGRVVQNLYENSSPLSAAFSPDGCRLATGNHDSSIGLWDPATGQRVGVLRGHAEYVEDVQLSPTNGRLLASDSHDKTLNLWDVKTGLEIQPFVGHTDALHSLAFSPDGRRLASACSDGTVKLWDVATGQATLTFRRHQERALCVTFSPDGRRVA